MNETPTRRLESEIANQAQEFRRLSERWEEIDSSLGFDEAVLPSLQARTCLRISQRIAEIAAVVTTTSSLFELASIIRFAHETSIWCVLFWKNGHYYWLYRERLWIENRDHAQKHLEKLRSDIAIATEISRVEAKEKSSEEMGESNEEMHFRLNRASEAADRSALKQAVLYPEIGFENGWSLYGHFVDGLLREFEEKAHDAEQHLRSFQKQMPSESHDLNRRKGRNTPEHESKWFWGDAASDADLAERHAYIYSYTSGMLHGGPSSFFNTDRGAIHGQEREMLLAFAASSFDLIIKTLRGSPPEGPYSK